MMRKYNRRHVKGFSVNEGVSQLIQQPLELQEEIAAPQPTMTKFQVDMMTTNFKLDKNSDELRKC